MHVFRVHKSDADIGHKGVPWCGKHVSLYIVVCRRLFCEILTTNSGNFMVGMASFDIKWRVFSILATLKPKIDAWFQCSQSSDIGELPYKLLQFAP